MKGRKAKPTHLKVLGGTARPDRTNPAEPMPRPIAPKPPAGLAPEARKVWKELAPKLERTRQLTEIDGPAFEVMCGLVALWRQAEKQARTAALGTDWRVPPEIRTMLEISEKLKPYFAIFGLSPADRARLTIPDASADDPLAELLEKAAKR